VFLDSKGPWLAMDLILNIFSREFGLFVDLSYSIGDFNMNPSLGVTS